MGRVWETGEVLPPREWQVLTQGGELRWIYSSMFPVYGEGGVAEVIRMGVDTTDRRKAEESQRLAAVGQLAAGVAHEFNNLLAALMLRAELTLQMSRPQDFQALADLVVRSAHRGGETCRNLTSFARPREPHRAAVSIETPIEAALAVGGHQLETAGIAVRREYHAAEATVDVDAGQLEQVFLNLLINAGHAITASHGSEGGTIVIETSFEPGEGEEGHLVARVSDDGIGIAPENLGRVFEPFFTTKRAGSPDGPVGAGLGLSVSHGLVAANGGTVAVTSQRGAGSVFELRFPGACDAAAPPAPGRPRAALRRTSARPVSILVAEDEEDLRDLLAEAFTGMGHRVATAADGAQAVAELQRETYDVVFTDLLMPGGGGAAVLEAARTLTPVPTVVVTTGRIEDTTEAEMLALGAARCLQKPLGLTDYLGTLEKITGTVATD
jgi:signal transduction histidine kinase/ActR/RegA family two-component response regulator